jgi:hypothetical protein
MDQAYSLRSTWTLPEPRRHGAPLLLSIGQLALLLEFSSVLCLALLTSAVSGLATRESGLEEKRAIDAMFHWSDHSLARWRDESMDQSFQSPITIDNPHHLVTRHYS